MFELSHKARISIIESLEQAGMRHSELCANAEVSPPEVTRHCKRLMALGIIKRGRDSRYTLTGFGSRVLELLQDMGHVSQCREFYNEEDLSGIPGEYNVHGILRNAENITGPMEVFAGIIRIHEGKSSRINIICDQTIEVLVPRHIHLLSGGTRVNILTTDDSSIPYEYTEYSGLNLEVRRMDRVPMGLFLSDDRGMFVPRHRRDMVDYNYGFLGRDPEFLRWCGGLFEHFWTRGSLFTL